MGPLKRLAMKALLAYIARMFSGEMAYNKVLGNVRHALTTLGGILIGQGLVTATTWETVSGILIAAFGVVWSMLVKRDANA